jgi:hypothetical protein
MTMANKDALLQVKITEKQKKQIEAAAKAQDVKVPAYVLKALDFYGSFDPAFWKKIETFSRNLGVKEYLILQNLSIFWMARREAEAEVLGDEAESILLEFQFTENGPVTGEDLHATLKGNFIRRYESDKEDSLRRKSQYVPLSDEEAEWLKARDEKLVNAVEAQKSAKENRAKGLVASYFEGEDEQKILAEMKAEREKAGL